MAFKKSNATENTKPSMDYPKIKIYEFLVSLCGGWCNGRLSVEALSYEEAYEKAQYRVVHGLVTAFPTLDIEYNVEPAEEYEEEE